jgi:organic radical activating enzyme
MSKWDQCIGNTVRPLFVITGGEPLLQDIAPLILALHEMSPFARVQIETAGPFFRDICAADYVTVIVSPKTNVVHPEIAKVARAYKYIIRATDKFHPETGTPLTSTQSLAEKTAVLAWPPSRILPEDVILQPCDEGDPVKNAANRHKCYELAMKHGYRAGLQLHKEFSLP